MRTKKILIISIIFLVLILAFPRSEVFSINKSDCEKYKNTCPDQSLISQIRNVCGTSILNSINAACANEKAVAEKRILELSSQKTIIEKKEDKAESYLSNVNYEIKKINAEIVSAELILSQIEKDLTKLNEILATQKRYLSEMVRQIYEYDTASYVEILLGNGTLSDFSENVVQINNLQKNINNTLKEVIDAKAKLEQKKEEQIRYKAIQESSRQSLTVKKQQQESLLSQLAAAKTPIEREIARLNAMIKELRASIGRIQSYFAGWLGYTPSWSQIWNAVSSASNIAGVDPFTMLGVLEVESNFRTHAGKNMGSPEANLERCHNNRTVPEPYCSREKAIFEEICAEVGVDPNKVPISYAYAMGPAQFIPSTWRSYSKKYGVRNPWNLNDAVLAMAWKLRNGGIAGYNPGGASWYVPRVEAVASRWREIYNTCGGFNLDCPNLRNYLLSKGIPAE